VALRLELRTSREELSDSFDASVATYEVLVEEFGSPKFLVVVVEPRLRDQPPPVEEYQEFVERLAELLRGENEYFRDVFHRVDLEEFLERGLYYVDLEILQRAEDAATGPGSLIQDLARVNGLAGATRLLAREIREGVEDGSPGPGAGESLEGLLPALEWQARFLEDPAGAVDELEEEDPHLGRVGAGTEVSPDGYLVSRGGDRFFLLAQPARETSSLSYIRPLVAAARARIAEVEADHPRLRAGVTGTPALIQEEMDAIRWDSILTTCLAAAGVIFLSLWAFHRVRLAPLVLVSLAMGLSWTAALITLSIGYLSLITSSFAVILIGLGIDYGVHLVSQYELERAQDRLVEQALGNSIRKTGQGLLTGAATTAMAFFTLTVMEFQGFAQLGFVAGSGILLCLVSMFTMLPALLALDGSRRDRLREPGQQRLEAGDRISRGILRFPWAVLAGGLALSVLLGWKALDVGYDHNMENLLPPGAESLRLQEALRDESELSPDFGVVLARDLEELEAKQQAAVKTPAIARRESILDYLPEHPREKQALLAHLQQILEDLELPPEPTVPPRPADLDASLAELEEALLEVEDLAFATGRLSLLEEAGQALEVIGRGRDTVRSASSDLQAAWGQGERRLARFARDWHRKVSRMVAQPPPLLEDLPEDLRSRFVGKTGKYLLYLHPEGNVAEPEQLEKFVDDCRKISPSVTGAPVVLHEHIRQITDGYDRAFFLATALAFGILLIDFRKPGYAVLAAFPTALGLVWMLGWMELAGLSFNLGNLIAAPLILGVGVDNGVHVIHRYLQEGKEGVPVVLHHTGRAILISSLTTMICFGSLALASHRGMASLGAILFFGVASCLGTSTVLLPCLLLVLARWRRRHR
jgi:hopanoid biosynthesis associated RND transporter like protein HpnN